MANIQNLQKRSKLMSYNTISLTKKQIPFIDFDETKDKEVKENINSLKENKDKDIKRNKKKDIKRKKDFSKYCEESSSDNEEIFNTYIKKKEMELSKLKKIKKKRKRDIFD